MKQGAAYTKKIKIQFYECDLKMRLRLSYLMRQVQQVGEDQLDEMGIGYRKTLQEHSMVFMLARIALKVERMPMAGEEIAITTRPLEPIKAQFYRETVVKDAQGRLLLTIWSAWLLFDPAARRVLRPNKFPYDLNCGSPLDDISMFDLALPESQPIGERMVRFSDVDVNHHLTNSVYSDIIYDFLPWQLAEEGELRQMCIHFQGEAKPGEHIAISTAPGSGKDYYVSGKVEDRPCFGAHLIFDKIPR